MTASFLDQPSLSQRFFFPRPAALDDPFFVDVADGARLACHYRPARAGTPTVVYFHGNGEVVADVVAWFEEWLSEACCGLLLAEYRGYGTSTGEPALVAMLDDVGPILASVRVPDERLVLFGRSLGAIYALRAARERPRAAGLIVESGVFDVEERVRLRAQARDLGIADEIFVREIARHFDHAATLARFGGRVLALHARDDEVVSVRHAEALCAAANEPKKLAAFERGGHNELFRANREAYVAEVESFLRDVAADDAG